MGRGGKEQRHGSAFSPCGCLVQRVEGAQHNCAAEMGPTGLHTLVPGNISSLDKAFRLTCLVPRVAHGQPGRKKIWQACKASQLVLHYSSGTETSGFCLVYQFLHIIPEMGWNIYFPSFWLVFYTQGESVLLSGWPCSEWGLETNPLCAASSTYTWAKSKYFVAADPPVHCSVRADPSPATKAFLSFACSSLVRWWRLKNNVTRYPCENK